jgi:signal peptidase II
MLIWLWLSALIIVIDQLTKKLVDSSMKLYQTIELIPHVQLTYMRNKGAAFSFLSGGGGWQRWLFITLAIAASGFIYTWLKQLKRTQRQEAIAWALILGGALGNLIDRVIFGYVIDFMDIYYEQYHWPAFNVADSAITIGVVTLLIDASKKN